MLAVEAIDIKKQFGRNEVLHGVNLSIDIGEKVMITGYNGSGKTTFLRCILSLYNFKGTLRIFNQNVRRNNRNIYERIAYLPQIPPPLSMTLQQLVEFASLTSKVSTESIYSVLDTLNLGSEHIKKPLKKLSGGMQKKAFFGLAIGRYPKMMILDEPVAGIYPDDRKIVVDMMNNLPEDVTLILTMHGETENINLTRRVYMDNGMVVSDEKR